MAKAKIVADPEIMLGKPIVDGTRITVEHILEELSHGLTFEELLVEYPTLTKEGILAALEYATEVLRTDIVYPAEQVK
jgi:uncharacterized protein (DUF433 family)